MAQQDAEVNGEDFSQDVRTGGEEEKVNGNAATNNAQSQQQDGVNGQHGSAEAPGRDDDRKLFVGGLSWETAEKELRDHFGQYGEIESINVKTDPQSGRSRGFAFIVYTTADAIDKVTAAGEHVINNKKVDPKKAKARHGKIFVGGLNTEITDDEIRSFFSQFGNIVEIEMPFDKQKNQRKGFCFITFDSEQVVNELLKTPKQTISGKEVDVKKATPKPDNMPMGMAPRGGGSSGTTRGGRGGRGGGGRGGYGQGWGSQNYGYGQGYGGYGGGYDYGADGYDYYTNYGSYSGYPAYSGYGYDYGSYGGYDGGYGNGTRTGGSRGGGKGAPAYQGKPRGGSGGGGGGRQARHQPY